MASGFARKLLHEPLFHFLLIGACLFLLSGLRNGRKPIQFGRVQQPSNTIVVTSADVNSLIANFTSLWRRPPTEEQIKGLIDGRIREEVYYREALKLGLDRDDTIVRGRLQEKLEFLSQGVTPLQAPTEQDLIDFLAKHPEDFSAAGQLRPLDEIRPAVAKQWMAAQRRAQSDAYYQNLLKGYAVTIEPPSAGRTQSEISVPAK